MSIIDTAKELLRKGIELGDPELIEMANKLIGDKKPEDKSAIILDLSSDPKNKTPKKKGRPPKKSLDTEEKYVINSPLKVRGEVQWSSRWVDPGGNGEIDKKYLDTPDVKRTERRSPYKKVDHICSSCKNKFQVYPHDKTEFYKCDKCLKSIIGR